MKKTCLLLALAAAACGPRSKKNDGDSNGETNLIESSFDKASPIKASFSIIQDGVCLEYDASYEVIEDKIKRDMQQAGGQFSKSPCSIEHASGRCNIVDAGSDDRLDHVTIKGTTSIVYYWTRPRDQVQKVQEEDCNKVAPGTTTTYIRY